MSDKVSDSIKYLMDEYKRLVNKKNKGVLTIAEKETLESLMKFLGKS
ncbi:hypothetical protein PQZ42_01295 [Alphaproteobacteria bacterium]|nr:hypothetical protein [Alphaproteobacteria bacterium]